MKFHAFVTYPGGTQGWRNHSREKLLAKIIVPFIQGQIVLVGKPARLLNMQSCTSLVAYKTADDIISVRSFHKTPGAKEHDCTLELIQEARERHASPRVTSLLQKSFGKPINQVFVIMRFGDKHLDSAYEMAIRPTIEACGLRCLRIDEVQDSGRVTDQILDAIAVSRLVLADLSGERPNCYYEAGFAHALGKDLILTIKKPERVHFDLSGYRFIEWETEAELGRKLKRRLDAITSKGEEEYTQTKASKNDDCEEDR